MLLGYWVGQQVGLGVVRNHLGSQKLRAIQNLRRLGKAGGAKWSLSISRHHNSINMKLTEKQLRLLQNGHNYKAWFAHEQRIARLYTQCQNLERARRVREDQNR
jgi:hypothetical protein